MPSLYPFVLPLVDKAPSPNDVKEGPWGILVFVFLIVATVLLLWSMNRQMKKAKAAREAGILPSQSDAAASSDSADDSADHPVDH